jgi:hypothetical protein
LGSLNSGVGKVTTVGLAMGGSSSAALHNK